MSNQDFGSDSGGSDIASGLPGSDEFTETSHKTWLEKILDSLKAILFGLIFVIGSGVLMFWNEGRSAQTAAALNEGAGQVLAVSAARVEPANEGKLVAMVPESEATVVLEAMKSTRYGSHAAAVGRVTSDHPGVVTIRNRFGVKRIAYLPSASVDVATTSRVP